MWASIPLCKQASKKKTLIKIRKKKIWKEIPSENLQINAIQRYALEENQPQLVTTTTSRPLGESPELHTHCVTALNPNQTLKWTKVYIIHSLIYKSQELEIEHFLLLG
jgi:hypothetical protein